MTEPGSLSPYEGAQPYIFISYAHNDEANVLAIVRRLQEEGYRVWFDRGIIPGKAWDENIGEKLAGCQCLLSFLSRSYVCSSNCRDELNMGRRLGKDILPVYLEEVTLSPGLRMRFGRLFALLRYQETEESFFQKLFAANTIHLTKE